jgi:hypothetical protein
MLVLTVTTSFLKVGFVFKYMVDMLLNCLPGESFIFERSRIF